MIVSAVKDIVWWNRSGYPAQLMMVLSVSAVTGEAYLDLTGHKTVSVQG
jgi:hypothetical protein